MRRWRDLASRVIVDDGDVDDDDENDDDDDDDEEEEGEGEEEEAAAKKKKSPRRYRDSDLLLDATGGGDKRKQRLMPIDFDYACAGSGRRSRRRGRRVGGGEEEDDDRGGDRGDRGGWSSSREEEEKEEEDHGDDGGDGGDSGGADRRRPRPRRRRKRPRVISLLDPTRTLDYEEELWRTVFRPVRTSDELEEIHALGGGRRSTTARGATVDGVGGGSGDRDDDDAAAAAAAAAAATDDRHGDGGGGGPATATTTGIPRRGCRHTLEVKRNLGGWFAKYSRMDAHSLGRLRVRDRHADPPPLVRFSAAAAAAAAAADDDDDDDDDDDGIVDTLVRFEILRHSQNLKRGSGVDGNRLEMELRGGQRTLLDLHRAMVEFALDGEASVGGGGGGGGDDGSCLRTSRGEGEEVRGEGEEEVADAAAAATAPLAGADAVVVSGVFFIEGTFYTCGEVGERVGESIRRWLDGKEEPADGTAISDEGGPTLSPPTGGDDDATAPPSPRRRRFLGLSPSSSPSSRNKEKIVPMSAMKLEDVPLRLGVRYFHMFLPPPAPSSLRLLLGRRHGNNGDIGENCLPWSLFSESAVFVTGIRTLNANRGAFTKKRRRRNNANSPTGEDGDDEEEVLEEDKEDAESENKAPILIHDTWAPQRQICLACNHSPASLVTVNDELTDAAPPGLDAKTNKVHLQGVPMCSSCYRALHYYRQQQPGDDEDGVGGHNEDDANDRDHRRRSLLLRPSKHGQASLVFPIEEYQRLVMATLLEGVPKCSAF